MPLIIIVEIEVERFPAAGRGNIFSAGGLMPKKAVWLIIIFTVLFILGINTGELDYLLNLGSTI